MHAIFLSPRRLVLKQAAYVRRCARYLAVGSAASAAVFGFAGPATALCTGAAAPYTIAGATATVNLDAACSGAGGAVTVTGNVSSPLNAALSDPSGGKQDWDITIDDGVTVSTQRGNAIRIGSPNSAIENNGVVQGTAGGVRVDIGAGSITNNGTITGNTADGIWFTRGGAVTNMAGATINAGDDSLARGVEISGGVGKVVNAGVIDPGARGYSILFFAGGTITNLSTGMLKGTGGVAIGGGVGTVTNEGSISSNGGNSGVALFDGGDVTNKQGGIIDAGDAGVGVGIQSARGTLTNAGAIQSKNGYGVRLSAGGNVTNDKTGVIESQRSGILIQVETGGVVNNGKITSRAEAGIHLASGGSVVNAGVIEGAGGLGITFAGTDDRLELQPGSAITGVVNAAAGADALVFGGSGTLNFDISSVDGNNTNNGEQYRNFETFLKEDDSIVTLNGNNSEITSFTVNGGGLDLNGNMQNAGFVVQNGVLGGTGTVASLNLADGTTLAPGNSIGTLNVAGNLTFGSGSTYQVEIAANGTSDMVVAGGTAAVNGTLNVVAIDGAADYSQGQRYTIVTANGGLSGTFSSITENSAFLNYSNSYDANNAYLTLSRIAFAQAIAETTNHSEIAVALDNFNTAPGNDASTVMGALLGLSEVQARDAFGAMQGDIHVNGASTSTKSVRTFHRTMRSESSAADVQSASADQTLSFPAWLVGFGSRLSVNGDGNASGYDADIYGLSGGFTFDFSESTNSTLTAGLSIGYSKNITKLDDQSQTYNADNYHIGFHANAGARQGETGLGARFAASYTHHDVDTTRTIAFGGLSRTALASYGTSTVAADAELRYAMRLPHGVLPLQGPALWAPFVQVQTAKTTGDAFRETGADAINLSSDGIDSRDTSIIAGVSVAGDYKSASGTIWKPDVSLAYERVIEGDLGSGRFSLAGSPNSFSALGPQESRNRLKIDVNSDVSINDNTSIDFGANAVLSGGEQDYSVSAAFRLVF